jgi:hypothetical protein
MLLASLNTELVKYGILIAAAPWWVPFVKALWNELNASLREEGGLFGAPPSAQELERMNRDQGAFVTSMVHEPRPDRPRARGQRNAQPSASAPRHAPRSSAAGRATPARPRGFRNR